MKGIAYFDKNCSYNHKYKISGIITINQKDRTDKCVFKIDLSGFKPETVHAIHIHEYGDISRGCKSAGGHYNPFSENHGCYLIHKKKRHVGDLVNNIISDKNGKVNAEFEDNLVNLFGKYSVFGRTIVIHSGEDDLGLGGIVDGKIIDKEIHRESLKTGNAGGRMACAIIGIAK